METLTEKKITRATFKSFINKHKGELYINNHSDFDGMTDCVQSLPNNMRKVVYTNDYPNDHSLGIQGVWLVGSSRDSFKPFKDEIFEGISVSNSCGSFTIAKIK